MNHSHHRNQHSSNLLATGVVLGTIAVGLYLCSRTNKTEIASRLSRANNKELKEPLEASINIGRSAEDLYNYWHDFTSLSTVMPFLKKVDDLGSGITRWTAKGSVGPTFVWESKVIDDIKAKKISWKSLEGSDVHTWGEVQFHETPDQEETNVVVTMNFEHFGGKISSTLEKFVDELERSVLQKGLKNLKEHMETRETKTKKSRKSEESEKRLDA